jgi:hypothetical protein
MSFCQALHAEPCLNHGFIALQGAEELEALRRALRGVVWTRSMRRMYTLVQRWVLGGGVKGRGRGDQG